MDNIRASAQNFSDREPRGVDRMSNNYARKTGGTSFETRQFNDRADEMRYSSHPRSVVPPARNSSGRGRRSFKRVSAQRAPAGRSEPERRQTPDASSYRSTTETPPSDEPRYSIESLGEMTAQQDCFLFNHSADGFLNIVEQSYNKMVVLDGRITETLPYSVYLHNMNQLYYVHLITIAGATGQQAVWEHKLPSDDFRRLIDADAVEIPEEIWFWLKGLGQVRDKDGIVWRPNFPYVMSPREARARGRAQLIGGDFGVPDADNHNVYENHIAPYTTRAFVTAMLNNQQVNGVINYQPLPVALTPQIGVPTLNFLGYYANNRPLTADCIAYYNHFQDNWATGLGARIGYNSLLWSKMNAVLHTVKSKMKMRIGLPPIDQGTFALFGSIFYEGPIPNLRMANGTIESYSELDPQSLSIAAIATYRRRRSEERSGCCYVDVNGNELPGWLDTINNERDMIAPFLPQVGDVNLTINDINFTREITDGRYNIILNEITRLTIIPR